MMQLQLYRHDEPMDAEELLFIQKKEEKERASLYKVVRILMVFCFICPFVVAWLRALAQVPNPFSMLYYFSSVLFLLCFAGGAVYIAYSRTLKKVQSDVRHRTKTVERTHITRKQFMPHNNMYYFFLDSPNKVSIEVSQEDYYRLEKGDELNIEYTTYSKFYLGYF